MTAMNSTGEKLRRANQLWHAYLASAGVRFDLAQFLKDPALEKQVLDGALASGDQKLIALAQDWLRDTGQAVPTVIASRVVPGAAAAPAPGEPPKPARYLRGVR
jgi:hypothetical protein